MRPWRRMAYRAARPLLFAADAELVHAATLSALRLAGRSAAGRGLCAVASGRPSPTDPVTAMGLSFRSRVGLGAGFDKDAIALRGWEALGLGFVEVGTVTPRPQAGSPRPRVFRLPADGALINRMGFNNGGADALAARVRAARPSLPTGFVVGISVGRNRDADPGAEIDSYVAAAASVRAVADYVVLNVSSPNTPGLRSLEEPGRVAELVVAVAGVTGGTPLLVKLSADLSPTALDALLDALVDTTAVGVILSNTTTGRNRLTSRTGSEAGGLSGTPLLSPMLAAVARARDRVGPRLAIIASGGIGSGAHARAAVHAGADLVQLWTGLVYAGPGLIGEAIRATR